ncbi:MAG: hypothetical protein J5633_01885 [Oscillospiraceae bacterium]|nr:hypothetical protein [Oscillospiraceae bacterium]
MKTKEIDSFLIVDGHVVTVSFSSEPNPTAMNRMKQMLLASYASNHRFADSDRPVYDNGGEAHVP